MRLEPVPPPSSARLAGLDGLRGVAVILVLGYHLWPATLPGGFVGVTLFFALSGYLITTLLLRELDRTGRIALGTFWARRARRLLPSALVVLVTVAAVWAATGWATLDLRREIAWAALQVANWGQVVASQAYGVDPDASPLTHYWSLAIEEQAYVVLPVVLLVARTSARRLGVALGALVLVSVGTIAWAWDDPVVTYLATPARIGEIALGGLAATLVHARRTRRPAHLGAADEALRAWSVTTWSGVAATAMLLVTARVAHLDDVWFARGAPLAAGVVATIAVTAAATDQRLGRAVDLRPLVWLGRISYALYLVHWPLLVAVRRAGLATSTAPWVTAAGSLVLAAAITRFVERPFRAGGLVATRTRAGVAVVAAGTAVALAATMLPVQVPGFDADRAIALAAERAAATSVAGAPDADGAPEPAPGDGDGTAASADPDPTPSDEQRIRSVWMSDSTGLSLVLGIPTTGRHVITAWFTQMGCPLGRGGEVRSSRTGQARWTTAEKGCAWDDWIARSFPADGAEVAIVAFGTWDVAERRVPGLGDGWTTIGDPAYDAWLLEEFHAATTSLLAAGAEHVAWLTVVPDEGLAPAARFARHRELVASHLDAFEGRASLIDLAGWLAQTGEMERLLPDGAHATFEPDGGTAAEIAERFLFRELERIVGR